MASNLSAKILRRSTIEFIVSTMIKLKSLYRKHAIEKVGHGKKAVFRTTIKEKQWSALTESEVKISIDAWIDEGVEP